MVNVDYFLKWNELDLEINRSRATGYLTKYISVISNNNVFITNNENNQRMLSIEFSPDTLKDYKPIDVNGINIEVKKNSKLNKQKLYLVLSNSDPKLDMAFIGFTVLIIDSIINCKDDISTLRQIEKALKDYHDYFSFSKQMSKMEEQGLLAELLYLSDLIDSKGEQVVNCWFGCEKNKRDFIVDEAGIEIKSTRNQEQNIVHISNENQLEKGSLDKLLLRLYVFDENESGQSVSEYIHRIYEKIESYNYKKLFLTKLMLHKIDPLNYVSRYVFQNEVIYEYDINDDFPKICRENIPAQAYDVKYKLNLSGIPYIKKEIVND